MVEDRTLIASEVKNTFEQLLRVQREVIESPLAQFQLNEVDNNRSILESLVEF